MSAAGMTLFSEIIFQNSLIATEFGFKQEFAFLFHFLRWKMEAATINLCCHLQRI